jgi:hypothetical protein
MISCEAIGAYKQNPSLFCLRINLPKMAESVIVVDIIHHRQRNGGDRVDLIERAFGIVDFAISKNKDLVLRNAV